MLLYPTAMYMAILGRYFLLGSFPDVYDFFDGNRGKMGWIDDFFGKYIEDFRVECVFEIFFVKLGVMT